MSERICIFAGTTEGRKLAELLKRSAMLTVCVATEYGEVMLEGIGGIEVLAGRMDEWEMERLFREREFSLVIDATHPYADIVTENIAAAAKKAGTEVMRILRDGGDRTDGAVYVSSADEAAEYLEKHDGRILLTTGAKELPAFSVLDMQRVWARVLPSAASLQACADAGVPTPHVIAAQGPFSKELNLAQLKMIGASFLVTKASGRSGGFEDKVDAALEAGAVPIVIGQPPQAEGLTMNEAVLELGKRFKLPVRKVNVIGIGPGSRELMTAAARTALEECDAVIGASSVTDVTGTGKPVFREFLPSGIRRVLEEEQSIRNAAVVMRGDTGFFSGAKKLEEELEGYDVTVIPGISSVSYLAAKLGTSWDDARLISMHGRDRNIARLVSRNKKMFVLCGGDNTPDAICGKLERFGFGSLSAAVGEKLSYPDERIVRGTVSELASMSFDPLSVLYIEDPDASETVRTGIPDLEFIRSEVPMTKAEVRAISLSKLELCSDSVVWDVGSGSGSVSVECALSAYDGSVYAIEKEDDALDLTRQNAVHFGADNITVVSGRAPEALKDLPAPTHVFIGGSSGGLGDIIEVCLEKNPRCRIVINTVTMETQAEVMECRKRFGFDIFEAVSVNIARSRKAGRYNLMTAQNPVFVFTMQKGETDD